MWAGDSPGKLAVIATHDTEGQTMATNLYRLGAWAFARRRAVVALWLVVLAAVVGAAFAVGGKENDKFSVPGTESQQAQELLEQKFPADSGTYARIVSPLLAASRSRIRRTARRCARRWRSPATPRTCPPSPTRSGPTP